MILFGVITDDRKIIFVYIVFAGVLVSWDVFKGWFSVDNARAQGHTNMGHCYLSSNWFNLSVRTTDKCRVDGLNNTEATQTTRKCVEAKGCCLPRNHVKNLKLALY